VAFWIGLLQAAIVYRSYTWLVSKTTYLSGDVVDLGQMQFLTCSQEALLLQKAAIIYRSYTWLYLSGAVVDLGKMQFLTCCQEALLLQKYLSGDVVDLGQMQFLTCSQEALLLQKKEKVMNLRERNSHIYSSRFIRKRSPPDLQSRWEAHRCRNGVFAFQRTVWKEDRWT
ncbi:hypothetical protein F2Q69_00004218, partial [Brassica cretica]